MNIELPYRNRNISPTREKYPDYFSLADDISKIMKGVCVTVYQPAKDGDPMIDVDGFATIIKFGGDDVLTKDHWCINNPVYNPGRDIYPKEELLKIIADIAAEDETIVVTKRSISTIIENLMQINIKYDQGRSDRRKPDMTDISIKIDTARDCLMDFCPDWEEFYFKHVPKYRWVNGEYVFVKRDDEIGE